MDINLLPNLGVDLVEFDDRLPSMRFHLAYKIEYLDSYFQCHNSSLWIECDVWDNWLKQIAELKLEIRKSAAFHDMDKDFWITLTRKSADRFELEVDYKFNELKMPVTKIISTSIISQECMDKLMSSCQEFPIMW